LEPGPLVKKFGRSPSALCPTRAHRIAEMNRKCAPYSTTISRILVSVTTTVPPALSLDLVASSGLPPVENTYDTTLGDAALALAKRWHAADVLGIGGNGPTDASAGHAECTPGFAALSVARLRQHFSPPFHLGSLIM
jgi:hypothetical protein